jgi:hypothetical protein
MLSFKAYSLSAVQFEDLLRGEPKVQLDLNELNAESFHFLAIHEHTAEFIRALQRKSIRVPQAAKMKAYLHIIQEELDQSMIVALLCDGEINPKCPVIFDMITDSLGNIECGFSHVIHVWITRLLEDLDN